MSPRQRQQLVEAAAPDADSILETIQECFTPDDVFTEEQLTEWAEENGFKKGEE